MTVITKSREQADALVRRWADEGCGFGRAADTPLSFLRAQWELWGDGRPFVSALQRKALMLQEVDAHPGILSSAGTACALAGFTARAAGAAALDRALGGGMGGLSAVQADLLSAVGGCLGRIRAAGLVEPGEAAALMRGRAPAMDVRLAEGLDLAPAVRLFFESLAGDAPAHPDGACAARVRFLGPAGPAAVLAAVIERIRASAAEGSRSILVCTADPERMLSQMAPQLASWGMAVALSSRAAVADTELGRAIAAMRALAEDDRACAAAADLAYSGWSGIAPAAAARMDAAWRGDRTASSGDMLAQLQEASPALAAMGRLAGWGPDAAAQAEALAALARAGAAELRDPACELRAIDAIRDALGQLDAVGLPAARAAELILDAPVPRSAASAPGAGCRVCFRRLADAADLAPASFDAVILDDLTDPSFDAASAHEASACLREALGLEDAASGADEARRAVRTAWAAARDELVCVVPARDAERDPAYPSFALEELLSELSGHPVDAAHAAEAMRRIDPGMRSAGEDGLVLAVGKSLTAPDGAVRLPQAERGRLRTLDLAAFIRRTGSGGSGIPILSPSAIESYARCPYSWFLGKRLGTDGLDEGFGPAEKGSFVHGVMARFYGAAEARGMGRADLAEGADAMLDAAFDGFLAEQPGRSGSRLIARTPSEHLEVEQLRSQLHRFIRLLALLPRSYRVLGHEIAIEPAQGVDYAGVRLDARADRIDADGEGRFAVLDYKGGVDGHAAGAPEGSLEGEVDLPERIQALIYAQAWRALHPGARAEAALYLSYKADKPGALARGSANAAAYDIPGAIGAGSLAPRMDLYLDAVERTVRPRLEQLDAGDIAPCEEGGGACRFCPYRGCGVRP